MSEEEKRNVFKINVPIFTNEEVEKLGYTIENDLDSIVNQISETVSRDRDIIILKKVIEKQQKEIEKLKDLIKIIRHEVYNNVIYYEEGFYRPAKNLTKQEVYKSYVRINQLLQGNYVFKDDELFLKELLEK